MRLRMLIALAVALATAESRPVQEVVGHLEARYQAASTWKAVFLEKYTESGGVRIESGTVYFRRPGQMRWDYEEPEKKLFLVDGKTAWFYVPADRTASRASVKKSEDWRTPLALLAGKAKLSRFCGEISLVDREEDGIPESRPSFAADGVLRCVPRGEERPRAGGVEDHIYIEYDPSYRIVRVLIREPGDRETEFRFAEWQENPSLSPELFRFEPPKGVAIVDESTLARGLQGP